MPTNPTIISLLSSYANKTSSAVEVVSDYLKQIQEKNGELNAVLSTREEAIDEAGAIDEARASGKEMGPLAGIPILIKDNILVRGQKACGGSQILENYIAAYSATVVERLVAAGAIILGRTNMDEFAMGSSTESSHFGPTKNPVDPTRVPGGSSGGSAAAVAAGFAPVALGSDTGGSIRQPASLCGIVGLKPTYGRVSRFGLMSLSSSLDVIGPMTNTVEDAELVMSVIEGSDVKDATSHALLRLEKAKTDSDTMKGKRIGVPREYFIDGMDAEVRARVEESIDRLREQGAIFKEISLPMTKYALETYYVIMPAEASSNLARYDGVRYGFSATGADLTETYSMTRGEGFGAEVKRRILVGNFTLSAGYSDAYYHKALKVRRLIADDFAKAFKDVDVIVGPTSPSVAWKIGEKFNDPIAMYLSDIYTVSANLAGIPGLSVPCGLAHGLPVGLQILGPHFGERELYRVGNIMERPLKK
ncbi:Asp-tRNA(Asn)/Glu-tRNA(Gln) amidotransferase subunit GatA [Candidatus Uhrbacteria bacterium]|nr:Asp-tRNA(Asn)/Glu-tRNA(Gln) amidotransferase subunit GatA [Candidatus Uhrbacteria bacterium]